jgi:membrane associated rhomboid family serine protease
MNNYRQSPFANLTPVVKNLLIINVIFFLATFVLGRMNINLVQHLSVFYFDSPMFKPWQVITYMFMHDPSGIWHILGNMFALFIFGPALEGMMGSKRFFNFYFICGIGALLCNMVVQAIEVHNLIGSFTVAQNNTIADSITIGKLQEIYYSPTLGASGAVFGILIAFAMLFPDVELMLIFLPIPIKAKYFVTIYVLFELFSGVRQSQGDSVAHFAHIGGALFGFIMIKIWGLNKRDNHYY